MSNVCYALSTPASSAVRRLRPVWWPSWIWIGARWLRCSRRQLECRLALGYIMHCLFCLASSSGWSALRGLSAACRLLRTCLGPLGIRQLVIVAVFSPSALPIPWRLKYSSLKNFTGCRFTGSLQDCGCCSFRKFNAIFTGGFSIFTIFTSPWLIIFTASFALLPPFLAIFFLIAIFTSFIFLTFIFISGF